MRYFALFFIIIAPVMLVSQNHLPVANNDTIEAYPGDSVTVNVLKNDYDPDGDSIYIFNALGGKVEDSTITYHLNFGDSYFQNKLLKAYMIKDEHDTLPYGQSWAIVVINILGDYGDSLDINNINAGINNTGVLFNNPDEESYGGHFQVPKQSQLNSIFKSLFWVAGRDDNNQINASTTLLHDVPYWPGPIAHQYDSLYDVKWYNIWKLNKEDIAYHREHYNDPGYLPIKNILTWPGNGDTDNGEPMKIAPFQDINNDDIYNPFDGDYPAIKGDQAVFWVMNDERYVITNDEDKNHLGVDIHGLAYAFDCPIDSALHNTLFINFKVLNRSDTNYNDVFLGLFTYFQLGNFSDNYSGSDTILNTYFVYNGTPCDCSSDSIYYGNHPPAQGVTFLNERMFAFLNYWDYYPYYPNTMHMAMQAILKDSSHLTYGHDGFNGSIPINYHFPDDPKDTLSGWTELTAGLPPSWSTGLGSVGPFELNSGQEISIDIAFPFALDYEGNYLTSVDLLKERISLLQEYYDSDTTPCGGNFSGLEDNENNKIYLEVFPNPFRDKIFVTGLPQTGNCRYAIYDLYGRTMLSGSLNSKNSAMIETNNINSGFYILILTDNDNRYSFKTIKQ